MKPFRLTKQAETHLMDIAVWTYDTFGSRQAEAYEHDLIERCEQISKGDLPSQSCAILLTDKDTDLRFVRSGQHFIVFWEQPSEVIIVDFVHSRSNLPAKIGYLESKFES